MCDQQRLRPACAEAQSDQSLCYSLEYFTTIKLLTEHHLEFLNLKGGWVIRGSLPGSTDLSDETLSYFPFEPCHEISKNVVCATSKGSNQPAHRRSLIRAFATRVNIL